jgi:hypothetical protein
VAAAEPGIAADRFAREIVGILTVGSPRSRQLNANPFGTRGGVIAIPFSIWIRRIAHPEGAFCQLRRAGARCAGVVRRLVVLNARGAEVIRRPVVLKARSGQRGHMLGVIPIDARCAARDPR